MDALSNCLAGICQQQDSTIIQRHDELHWLKPPHQAAAVLIPIVNNNTNDIILIERAAHLKSHAGQISFPGGKPEETDNDLLETALRETQEEIGLKKSEINILGSLQRYLTGTNYLIQPYIGRADLRYELQADPSEVEQIIYLPLAHILKLENFTKVKKTFFKHEYEFYAIDYQAHHIWGATAIILQHLAVHLTNWQFTVENT